MENIKIPKFYTQNIKKFIENLFEYYKNINKHKYNINEENSIIKCQNDYKNKIHVSNILMNFLFKELDTNVEDFKTFFRKYADYNDINYCYDREGILINDNFIKIISLYIYKKFVIQNNKNRFIDNVIIIFEENKKELNNKLTNISIDDFDEKNMLEEIDEYGNTLNILKNLKFYTESDNIEFLDNINLNLYFKSGHFILEELLLIHKCISEFFEITNEEYFFGISTIFDEYYDNIRKSVIEDYKKEKINIIFNNNISLSEKNGEKLNIIKNIDKKRRQINTIQNSDNECGILSFEKAKEIEKKIKKDYNNANILNNTINNKTINSSETLNLDNNISIESDISENTNEGIVKKNRKKSTKKDDDEIRNEIKNKIQKYHEKKYVKEKIMLNRESIKMFGNIYSYIDNIDPEDIENNLLIKIGKNKSRFRKLSYFCNVLYEHNDIMISNIYLPIYTFQDLKEKDLDDIIIYIKELIKK